MLTCGGLSQQFSIPEHVAMSAFTAEYLRHAGEHLRILGNAFFVAKCVILKFFSS